MIKHCLVAACMATFIFTACNNQPTAQNNKTTAVRDTVEKDLHTQSNTDSVTMQHVDLDISVDFDKKKIAGKAIWTIDNKGKVSVLTLDTYDLTIDSVFVDGGKVVHTLDKHIELLGSALHIPISANSRTVAIYYSTGAHATALQWLQPQQTHDKKHPFLYTQSESIFARSWVPCADGPGIRFTYAARVTVPKGLLALMSAENPTQVNDSSVYHFKMEIPIPAYLMALAVGDIAFKSIDGRTGVYAERGMIDKARYEFEDVGKMVTTAEKLYGPYRWGRYDALVLPPGFPIGGMENPRLTFCTPTIIAGDRSLMNLIAHELAHNWSGNLVTNATWNDFWLNEGFTVYFERRITEAMMGKEYVDMLWELGYLDLANTVHDIGDNNPYTCLKLNLQGKDPDEGLTDIAYEKGAHLLKLIENTVGREKFDVFLKQYFNEHAFKSINTEQFLTYLDKNLFKGDTALANKIDIHTWVYGPGLPANCPRADKARFNKVDGQVTAFSKGVIPTDTAWTTNEWLYFLRKLPRPLSQAQVIQLDAHFHLSNTGNSEILELWYIICIESDYKPVFGGIENFLSSVGRRKFLEPLYTEMMKTPEHQAMAKRIYQKYRDNYHPLAQTSLDEIVLKK